MHDRVSARVVVPFQWQHYGCAAGWVRVYCACLSPERTTMFYVLQLDKLAQLQSTSTSTRSRATAQRTLCVRCSLLQVQVPAYTLSVMMVYAVLCCAVLCCAMLCYVCNLSRCTALCSPTRNGHTAHTHTHTARLPSRRMNYLAFCLSIAAQCLASCVYVRRMCTHLFCTRRQTRASYASSYA